MRPVWLAVVGFLGTILRRRLSLQLEVVALRHQLSAYERSRRRLPIEPGDPILWSWLARLWPIWRQDPHLVRPRPVLESQKRRFRERWRKRGENGRHGRPPTLKEVRELIRRLSRANPTRGSPRIVCELHSLGIEVAKSTVEKYRIRPSDLPSPSWRAFLDDHLEELVFIDFVVVPTVRFKVLLILLVLTHNRRRVVHFNATANPTAQWTAQQTSEAFPFDTAPRCLAHCQASNCR